MGEERRGFVNLNLRCRLNKSKLGEIENNIDKKSDGSH